MENDGNDIMGEVVDLKNRVTVAEKEIEKANQKIDNHTERDNEKFEVLTNAVVEMKEMHKESKKSNEEFQKSTSELIMSVKDLVIAVRGETVDKIHSIEKDLLSVKHDSEVADLTLGQDLKVISSEPKSQKTRFIEFIKLPPVLTFLGGVAILGLYLLEQKFGVKITP